MREHAKRIVPLILAVVVIPLSGRAQNPPPASCKDCQLPDGCVDVDVGYLKCEVQSKEPGSVVCVMEDWCNNTPICSALRPGGHASKTPGNVDFRAWRDKAQSNAKSLQRPYPERRGELKKRLAALARKLGRPLKWEDYPPVPFNELPLIRRHEGFPFRLHPGSQRTLDGMRSGCPQTSRLNSRGALLGDALPHSERR